MLLKLLPLFNWLKDKTPESIKRFFRPVYVPLFLVAERRRLCKLYAPFISSRDLVFDIGAHKGDITTIFLQCGARVIAVEPQPDCVALLQQRFSENERVVIVPKGVGHKEGVLPLAICSSDTPIASFSQAWKKKLYKERVWDKEICVPVTTLNHLIKEYGKPAFCKIDVEGFEHDVFQGLTSSLPFLCFEFHREVLADTEKCMQRLLELGNAEFNYTLYSDHRLALPLWVTKEEALQQLNSIDDPHLCGDIFVKFIERKGRTRGE